jgi:hypothetical protein
MPDPGVRTPLSGEHTHVLSCGCPVTLPARMAAGREVLCAGHGPVSIRTAPKDAR